MAIFIIIFCEYLAVFLARFKKGSGQIDRYSNGGARAPGFGVRDFREDKYVQFSAVCP